ncbi:AraC family transcriptional regulator [Povalibacter sp.]|uniref:AraC family transcriptional regulator n=1 Tax=Povalibacter sp. TaxID=1962978 RepID=UPI002F41F5FD
MNAVFVSQPSTLGSWVKALRRCLDAQGVDSVSLMRRAGIEPQDLDDPEMRLPVIDVERFWSLAVAAADDPLLGLRTASYVSSTSSHALGFSVSASSTLKEAFERIARYSVVVSDAAEYELVRRGGEYQFRIHFRSGWKQVPELVDMIVALYVRICRAHLGRDFSPRRIELRRSVPSDEAGFDRILRSPVRYACAQDLIAFDRAAMERPTDSANPVLAHHNDVIVQRMLLRLGQANIRSRVRAALADRLELGEPAQQDVAGLLNMCSRTLQRRLSDCGTSYKELLDDTRRELAMSYLGAQGYSVSCVTHLVGFASSSSFTRAFRRWTGRSPTDWREQWRAGAANEA